MKVVHLSHIFSHSQGGGAAVAAARLHEALLDAGVESHFVCVLQRDEGRNVHQLPNSGSVRQMYLLAEKILRAGWKMTPFRKGLSTNLIPLPGLRKLLDAINPDILHIHWINYGVASQESLARLPYPIVINLHDLWPIDALNFHPGDDRRFITGMTMYNSNWLERWMLNRKRNFCNKKRIAFIGPSEWVVKLCRQSVVGRGRPACAIPNIIDPVYEYDGNLIRHHDKCVFLFGCNGGIRNQFKGFDDIVSALKLLPSDVRQKIILRLFGQNSGPSEVEGVAIECLGSFASPTDLKRIYHEADVFLFPSKQETQGMTKIEALLCGLPVIAFDRTACAEGIVDGQNGWIVKDGAISEFAQTIVQAVEKWEAHALPSRGRVAESTKEVYSQTVILKKIVSVYEKLEGWRVGGLGKCLNV